MNTASKCPRPHKQSFPSKKDAKRYLKQHQAYYSKEAPKIYIYHCSCGLFHLTSQQKFSWAKPRRQTRLAFAEVFQALVNHRK